MNATAMLFDAGEMAVRPCREAARPKVEVVDEDVTGVAGAVARGPLLDRLNLVDVADDRVLRPIGPGGYSGGECYRTLVEVLLAGGEFLSTGPCWRVRPSSSGRSRAPSHTTLYRFVAGADFGGPEGWR